jgi:predicted thioesterase
MKKKFAPGDTRTVRRVVDREDIAAFDGSVVHEVYSTFAIARDMEWSSRQFVLEMREDHEEGVGTFVHVEHHAPAFVGNEVSITATVESLRGNELVCTIEVTGPAGRIASGRTGQKILTRDRLSALMKKAY